MAVFFGVKIDDLFSVNTDDKLERIDYMIHHEKLTDENFNYAKRVLESILSENEKDVNAIIRYTQLIMNRNKRDFLFAGNMLERAMQAAPLNEEIYGLYASVRECRIPVFLSGCDRIIRVCEPYARQYPSNAVLMKLLIELMIEREYYDKAAELIELLQYNAETGYGEMCCRTDTQIFRCHVCACVFV